MIEINRHGQFGAPTMKRLAYLTATNRKSAFQRAVMSLLKKLEDVERSGVSMSGEGFAGRFSHPLVGIMLKLLKGGKYASLVDRGRAIAKHMNNPPANPRIGIVGHLQEPLPNLWIVDLYFTRTESRNGLAPHIGIAVSAQFEQAWNF